MSTTEQGWDGAVAYGEGHRTMGLVPLEDLRPNPMNPKGHSIETIDASVGRFGYVEPIVMDERTGYLISGHGRRETLLAMKERGETAPEGVTVDGDGRWRVPVARGWRSRTDTEAAAALIALNRTTELGGWVDDALLDILDTLTEEEDGLAGVGFEHDEVDDLRERLQALTEDEEGDGSAGEPGTDLGQTYTMKTDVPQYQITGEEPALADLVDRTKTEALTASILAADVPDEVQAFLVAGAQRHLVFDYAAIAEFYAHAEPAVQALMEESALVILDVDDAIKHGFAKFGERLQALFEVDLAAKEERGFGALPPETAEDLEALDLTAGDLAAILEEAEPDA